MDGNFQLFLRKEGLSSQTMAVLQDEDIISKRVLAFLHEEHLTKLLAKITVGQHAILTTLWQQLVLEAEQGMWDMISEGCSDGKS